MANYKKFNGSEIERDKREKDKRLSNKPTTYSVNTRYRAIHSIQYINNGDRALLLKIIYLYISNGYGVIDRMWEKIKTNEPKLFEILKVFKK